MAYAILFPAACKPIRGRLHRSLSDFESLTAENRNTN